eukprot:gene2752-3422_t
MIENNNNFINIDGKQIHKKYVEADGRVLSKEEYRIKVKNENKKRKIENRRVKKINKKTENYKKNEDEGNVTKELLEETSYHFENGLRMVHPYEFTFKVHAKERWFDRKVLEMFSTEFSELPAEIYRRKILRGWIQINQQPVTTGTTIKLNDMISHRVHRHEPPVSDQPVRIISLTDEVVVVDKPSSIPVHPCGRFRHNSLIFILAAEHGLNHLYGVHRIDRLTSGLLMLARTPAAAKAKASQIQQGSVMKKYLALVKGRFPTNTEDPEGETIVDQPLVIQNMRLGMNHVGENGKPSKTHFKLLSYNAERDTSVVECTPKTGRTHQIRIHLQWLGYPIANDPLYNNEFKKSRGTKSLTSDGLDSLYSGDIADLDDEDGCNGFGSGSSNNNNNEKNEISESLKALLESQEPDDESIPIKCLDCENNKKWQDPSTFSFGIYLHALEYKSNEWSYKTELPIWAKNHTNSTTTTTTTTDENPKKED